MALRNTAESWGWPARLMHWAGAAVVLFQLGLGFYMVYLVPSLIDRLSLTQLHKSWGFIAFVLVALRLAWRAVNRAPALPAHMGPFARGLAHGGHFALYVLLVVMPLSGWLFASASPLNDADAQPFRIPNMVFELFELPDPFQPGDKALSDSLGAVHLYCGLLLSLVVVGHVLAALKHQAMDRDGLLTRMVLGRARPE